MSKRNKLFRFKKPYQVEKSNQLFFKAMKENCRYQYQHCPEYRHILESQGFNPGYLKINDENSKNTIKPKQKVNHHNLI